MWETFFRVSRQVFTRSLGLQNRSGDHICLTLKSSERLKLTIQLGSLSSVYGVILSEIIES